jgi:hypothetical protein
MVDEVCARRDTGLGVLDYFYSRIWFAMSRRVRGPIVALTIARGVPSEVERKIVRPCIIL